MTYPVRFACWTAEEARTVLATEALEGQGNEAQFMATHLPITGFEVTGTHASEVEVNSEDGLLATLTRPNLRHAFCVVEGEAGSGKSHLIRWLYVKWLKEGDLVLLVQRADGSLEGTLRQLRNSLPSTYRDLFQGLGQRQEATLVGRSRFFQASLAQTLRPDFFEVPQVHSEWCGEWHLDELINHTAVLERWRAPLRILKLLSGAEGDRNSALADFNVYDVAELASLETYIDNPSTKVLRFLRLLKKEAQDIYPLQKSKVSPSEAWQNLGDAIPQTKRLVEVLNARMNTAVQNVLGISAHELRELFFKLRADLKKEGRRLVLLLEDITNFQGIDNQLIDVLVTQSTTRAEDDLCDLISVVGITPAYYQQHLVAYANYVERITYHIVLGSQVDQHFQDVAFLRSESAQVAFATRYLAAARLSSSELDSWYASQASIVPNRCIACNFRESCHEAFGELEGVGLYPFTRRSITQMFSFLEDPAGTNTQKTPRGLIQGILSPTLLHPHAIEAGQYPSAQIEVSSLPEPTRRVTGLVESLLRNRVENASVRDRLRRLLALWGDRQQIETTRQGDEFYFAGIAQGVFETFGLDWLGDGSAVPVEEPRIMGDETRVESISSPVSSAGRSSDTPKSPAAASRTPKSPATHLTPSQLQKRLNQISAWRDGKKLEDPAFWQKQLAEMVFKLSWTQLGVPLALRNRFFTENTILIEGTGKADTRHFVLPAQEWLIDGLESLAILKAGGGEGGNAIQEVHRRQVARLHRKLCGAVVQHTQKKTPLLADGKPWSIVGAATQILAVRSWLRGSSSPTENTAANWSDLLSDELDATSNPEQRVDSWADLLVKTKGSHEKVRELLRQMVQLPQGTSSEFGVAAAGEAAGALLTLRLTMQLSPVPTESIPTTDQTADLARTAQYAAEALQRFSGIAEREYTRLCERAREVEADLRHFSIHDHIARIDRVVETVTSQLSQVAPLAIDNWGKARRKLEDRGLLGPGGSPEAEELERFLDIVRDLPEEFKFSSEAERLAWDLTAPANALAVLTESLRVGEDAISAIHEFATEFIAKQNNSSSNSLSDIHDVGETIVTVCSNIRGVLESPNG